jgi:hypothetical protein
MPDELAGGKFMIPMETAKAVPVLVLAPASNSTKERREMKLRIMKHNSQFRMGGSHE